jgi:AraC-like DNA-binding protein
MLLIQVIHQQVKVLFQQDKSVQSVVYALDQIQITNFRRVFKSWAGKPPQEYINLMRELNPV